ncbi:helix-turn-helix domain-containing protein [Nocardia sp. NPDC006630]|uniref:TetR/AcrR family transcriptional regulator n=1 Tax=Nocardia sp. NPDC006630 TaxID=3157181 RepID=UPI0033BA7EBA
MHARVLEVARQAFGEQGDSVSLAEIARRAGVGAGTVYRYFPTKAVLLEAVLEQRIERLTVSAVGHLKHPDPGVAFFEFCVEVIASEPMADAPCDLLTLADGWPRARVHGAGVRFRQALTLLLAAAQRDGAVRPDIVVADVVAIFTACVTVQRLHDQAAPIGRTTALILDSMRTERPSATTLDVTSTPRSPAAGSCQSCGCELSRAGTGRRPRYCSPACRQRAHRERARLAAPSATVA